MNIVLIDDHLLFVQSLKNLLSLNGYQFISVYESVESYTANNGINYPDIIITDLNMPGINGMKFLQNFERKNDTKIIILSISSDVQTIKQAIRIGAKGFLTKNSNTEDLIEAIEEVYKGNQYIQKSLRDILLDNIFTEQRIIFHLSPREKDVLNKVCAGNTIKEIAYELNLSPHTVQYYHRNIMTKLKLKKTADLIVFAIQHGFYSPKIN